MIWLNFFLYLLNNIFWYLLWRKRKNDYEAAIQSLENVLFFQDVKVREADLDFLIDKIKPKTVEEYIDFQDGGYLGKTKENEPN